MSQPVIRPTSIRIFLAQGRPDGLRIIDKSNWTGRAIVAGRADADAAFQREELARPGVYVLTGSDDDGTPQLYIGEADVLCDRLRQHVARKDFWTRFVAFTSANEGLNKASVRYLEARLIGLARTANQWQLENGTTPETPPLSEADCADAEWYLAEMRQIFPLLGIDAFEDAAEQARAVPETADTPDLFLNARGADGRGREVGDGFIVFKGSKARLTEVPSIQRQTLEQRRDLHERAVLVEAGDHLVFTQDYRFTSPSAAASVLVGGPANGRENWKDRAGTTLKELQSRNDAD